MDRAKENDEFYRRFVIYGALAVLSIALLGVGYWLHQAHRDQADPDPTRSFAEHFADELGIAGIVALILALTIESLSHREFRKLAQEERDSIKRDVFHYVYGHWIPEEVRTEIDAQILKSLFIKRNLTLTHEINPYHPNPKYVILTTHITYELYNLTGKTQTYHLLTFSEAAPEPGLQEEARYLSIRVDDCEHPFALEGDQLVASQNNNKIGGHLCVEKDIGILHDRPARFALSMKTLKSLEDGYDIFLCSDPTCGFDLKVNVQSLDLEVSAHAFHPETMAVALEHNPTIKRHHWSIKRPLLIHQGAYVYWRPKRTTLPAPQSGRMEIAARKEDGEPVPLPKTNDPA